MLNRVSIKVSPPPKQAASGLRLLTASDEQFLALLPLIEQGAHDERNFVKKGVNWALRRIGTRNLALNAAAGGLARRLSLSEEAACRWVGKDALRDLANPKLRSRLVRRAP
jgi:3-methyladenine DNA glycosylase AlkD